jgi:hypothetical protein
VPIPPDWAPRLFFYPKGPATCLPSFLVEVSGVRHLGHQPSISRDLAPLSTSPNESRTVSLNMDTELSNACEVHCDVGQCRLDRSVERGARIYKHTRTPSDNERQEQRERHRNITVYRILWKCRKLRPKPFTSTGAILAMVRMDDPRNMV